MGELLQRMGSAEITDWEAFFLIEAAEIERLRQPGAELPQRPDPARVPVLGA